MGSNGSFYQNGLPLSTLETGLGGVDPGAPAPKTAESSFYLSGSVYATLMNSDALLAAITAQQEIATTQAGISTTQASASSASAAASAASAAAAVATLASSLLKVNNLSDLTSVPTAKINLALVKSDVGLSNVDNTSDVNKPVSTAQAAADAVVTAAFTSADALKANIASPTFTGVPAAPTASAATNTTQLATTAFVSTAIANLVASSPATLDTLNELAAALGNDPNFATTTATSIGLKAPLASPALTGVPTAPTAAAANNTTQLATTAFVEAARVILAAATALKADIASPTLTGTPAAPTAAVDTNTTQIATTAMVLAQAASATPLIDGSAAVGTSTRFARGDHVHPTDTTRAALASPTFTGVPAAPTASPSTNTTQLATTAFVAANPVTVSQLNSGTAATSSTFWRGDGTWATPAGGGSGSNDFRNALYANGGFEVWQRGAGGAASIAQAASLTAYTADRWFLITGATQASVVSQQAGLSPQSRWAGRVLRNSGQTGVTVMRFEYPLTTDEVIALRGQNISFQAYLKAGANWSPASGTLSINAYFGTGAEGKRGAVAYTGETNPLTTSTNITTTAAQYTFTGASTVATNVTQGCLQFSWTPVGTAGAADSFDVDDVQLEAGTSSTTFERLSFPTALRECQRHYAKSFNYATAPAQNAGLTGALYGSGNSAAAQALGYSIQWRYPVSMRVAPTLTFYNPAVANANMRDVSGAVDGTVTAGTAGTEGVGITATSAGITDGAVAIHAQADAGL